MLHNQIHQILTELRKTPKISENRPFSHKRPLNFDHMKILKIPTYSFGQAKPIGEGIFQIGQPV